MGYKIVVNEYSNLPGLNSTKVLVSEYAAIGTKTSKVIVVEDANIGTAAYNEAKAAAVTATNAANQATATLANVVPKSGGSMTGNLSFPVSNQGILFQTATTGNGNGLFGGTGDGASETLSNIQLKSWYGVGIAPAGSNPTNTNTIWFNARNGNIGTVGDITANKSLVSAAQGTEANSLTRKDYVDAQGKGSITTSISLPAGAPATGWIPVIFENIGSSAELYISTAGGGAPIPMNNCSFNGIVRASGYGDGVSYCTGMFTIYQTNERAIHSVHAPSESTNAAVFFVETRAFPITVAAVSGVTVRASATNLTYGTSVFAVNGQEGVGNTKTMTLANFASGTGIYKGSSIVQNQDEQDARYLLKGGDTMTGQLVVSQSGNASIVINSTTGNDDQLQFQNNGKLRWLLGKDAVAETGGNVGSDLNLFGYNDDGTFGGSVLKVRRSTRQLEFQTQPLSIAAQSTSQYALTRRDWVEGELAKQVSKTGDTMTGDLFSTKTGAAITFKIPTGASNIILGQTGSDSTWTNNWYVGRGSGASDDVQLYSYVHGTNLTLASDRITFNKSAYVGASKVIVSTDEYVWKNRGPQTDLGLVSAVLPGYFSFNPGASSSPDVAQYGHGFNVNPGSNAGAGVWSSQFAITHGTPNKLYHRSGINGAAQGNWKKIYTSDDKPTAAELGVVATSNVVGSVSQSAGVPTGAIIERGTFAGGEYVKYSDGTMMQWGRLSISNRAVTSAVGSIFQSAALDTINYGPAFVGNPSPQAQFLYSSGGGRPWPILTSSTSAYASFVLQCGVSVSAMAGDYVWQAMGRWF